MALGTALAASALAGCATAPSSSTGLSPVPLAAATESGPTAVVTLPMGDLSSSETTFWQLFVRAGGRWHLATPPNVETSGGVVVGTGRLLLTAGVLPTDELRFSPLVRSVDGGRSWSTAVAPGALVVAPDALAPAGTSTLAVLGSSRGQVVRGSPSLSSWTIVATRRAVAAAGTSSGCAITAFTAVATWSGAPLVGGGCTATSHGPVALLHDGRWRLVGPTVGHVRAAVLRLVASTQGVAALLEVVAGTDRELLFATSRGDFHTWVDSSRLLVTDDRVVSTTIGSGRASVTLERPGGALVSYTTSGSGWGEAVSLPASTVDVVGEGASLEALAGSGSVLTVYLRDGGGWRVLQRISVPIAIGAPH